MPSDLLIVDANVLIDYVKSDRTILALVSKHIASLHVPSPLLEEVEGLDDAECQRLGLVVVEPGVDQLLEAGRLRGKGGLSFEDYLCLIIARDSKWVCVSNDGPLRKACTATKVGVRWGLELMLELVEAGQLPATAAIEVAEAIHKTNPRYINRKIVDGFAQKVSALGSSSRMKKT